MAEYLIVGVDPGTTTGVAALDLTGRVVGVHSSKDMGLSAVVKTILSLGTPSLIACDVNPPPDLASKVAVKFGVSLFVPERTLSVSEKLGLTRDYELSDSHQRDALASALHAFSQYRNKLQKIESLGLGPKVKHFVLHGKSISAAKSALEPIVEEVMVVEKIEPKKLSEDEMRIRSLEKRVRVLLEEIRERDGRIRKLREKLAAEERRKHIKREAEPDVGKRIGSLEAQMRELTKTKSLLEQVGSGEVLLVGVYPNIVNGLTLVERKPEDVNGIDIAFTSKSRVREYLLDKDVTVHGSNELNELMGFHYIPKRKLSGLTEETPDIEQLITEYRRKRS